jgi:hypothetical protein
MKIKTTLIVMVVATILAMILAVSGAGQDTSRSGKKNFAVLCSFGPPIVGQDAGQPGFVIKLKNGSTLRGRTLSRDDANGSLRLVMTEASDAAAKSYAVIAADDTAEITSSSSDSESIRIKLKGGSDLRCKEFSLSGDSVAVKLGSASKVEIKWSDIESISFSQ